MLKRLLGPAPAHVSPGPTLEHWLLYVHATPGVFVFTRFRCSISVCFLLLLVVCVRVYERVKFSSRFLHDQRVRLHRRFDELIVSGTHRRAYVCRRWRARARSHTHHEVGIRINHRRSMFWRIRTHARTNTAPHRIGTAARSLYYNSRVIFTPSSTRGSCRCAHAAIQTRCSEINFTKVLISIRNPIWFSNYGKPIGNVFITNTFV